MKAADYLPGVTPTENQVIISVIFRIFSRSPNVIIRLKCFLMTCWWTLVLYLAPDFFLYLFQFDVLSWVVGRFYGYTFTVRSSLYGVETLLVCTGGIF